MPAAGFYDKAVVDLQNALALEPEHTDALLQLGAAYEKLGSLQHAYDTLSALIRIDPNNAKALYARGACLNLMGQDAKALGMLVLCILGIKSMLASEEACMTADCPLRRCCT